MKIGFVAMCLALSSYAIQIRESEFAPPQDLSQGSADANTGSNAENPMLMPLAAMGAM